QVEAAAVGQFDVGDQDVECRAGGERLGLGHARRRGHAVAALGEQGGEVAEGVLVVFDQEDASRRRRGRAVGRGGGRGLGGGRGRGGRGGGAGGGSGGGGEGASHARARGCGRRASRRGPRRSSG